MTEFCCGTLNDVVSLVIDYRGKTPKKLGSNWSAHGYRALSAKNIKTGQIVQPETIRYVDETLYKKWMKDEIKKGDILITSEAPFGQILFWDTDEKIVLSQRIFGLRVKQTFCPAYVYYYMTSTAFQAELDARATGTTVTGLRQPELLKCRIRYPDKKNQQQIANILLKIDNKISLNTKINNNLEQQAQILFQQHFGNKEPNGILNDILDEMPKSKIKVGDAKDVSGPYPFFTSGQNILEYTEALVDGRNIFLNTGGNADVKYYMGSAAYSTDTWCIKAKNNMTDMLYLLLKGMQTELDLVYFEGSALRHLQKPKLKSLAIYIPSDEELKIFNSIVASLFNKIAANVAENKILEHTRDALLPKLMSGEIDVSKVDISDPSCLDKSLFNYVEG